MFSRRRQPPPRPIDASTQAAATTAANSAFLNKSRSNGSLSSAAAAAALRSHTSSPEPVGSIQTKRMARRGSTSSNGSAAVMGGGNGRPGLTRADSNGSMTERTFRTASPSLRNGSQSPSARPSSSLAYSGPRLASPPPANGQRSSSADQAAAIPAASARAAKRLSNVAEAADDEDELDMAHANFVRRPDAESDTAGSPPASPTTGSMKKYTHGMGSWFKGGSGSADSWPRKRPQSSDGRTFSMPSSMRPAASSPVRPSSATGRGSSADRSYGITPGTSYSTPMKVYDPNSRSFVYSVGGKLSEPPSPTTSRPAKVETVYDPNSRTFVPKTQIATGDSAPPRPVPSPASVGAVLTSKKQRAPSAAIAPVEPPPRNPARISRGPAEAESPLAITSLRRKPSVVHEDPEAEQAATAQKSTSEPKPGSKRDSAVLPAKTYVSPSSDQPRRSASLDVPSLGMEPSGRGRIASESPQRSARFSPSPILKPQIHVPPPRDVSPAKSALKQSPASSVRTASPITTFHPVGIARVASPASETSETPSLASQDGKRKKSVRVSFNEHAEEIVPPTVVASTIIAQAAEMEDDTTMHPRPAMPSFASIRRDRIEDAEKVTETPPARHGPSSDHAIAGILRKANDPLPPEVTSKESAGYVSDESSEADIPNTIAAPAPAKLEAVDHSTTAAGASNVRDFAAITTVPIPIDDVDVPSIALLPPTPKLDDDSKRDLGPESEDVLRQNRNSMEGIAVPGGWGKDPDDVGLAIAETPIPTPEIFDAGQHLSTEDSAATMTVSPVQLTASPLQMSDIDEESDDAEFSDAFEDPSDFEDDAPGGFASLDAIVESPVVIPPSPTIVRAAASEPEVFESPSVQQSAKTAVAATESDEPPSSPIVANWDEATMYWSKLSREKRAQIEREHLSSDDEPTPPVKKVRPKSALVPSTSSAANKRQMLPPALKKSMRAQPGPISAELSDGSVHMRKSMRDGGGNRTSLRSSASQRNAAPNETTIALQKTLRPSSAGGYSISSTGTESIAPRQSYQSNRMSQDSSRATLRSKNAAPQARTQMPQVSPRLQRELARAGDSDSESSFKKRRRAKNAEGLHTMRGSMRGASIDQPEPSSPVEAKRPVSPTPRGKSLGSRLRSLSPAFSRNKGQNAQASVLRNAARGSSTTSLERQSQPPPKSKARQIPAPAPVPAPRFRSRFADSDDEDEDAAPQRSYFRSRFADSDDEGEPAGVMRADLTPVRGIPRRKGQEDGDSTDLSDENDTRSAKTKSKLGKKSLAAELEVDKVMELARRNLGLAETPVDAPSSAHQGDALQKGSLRSKPFNEQMETPSSTVKPADVDFSPPDRKRRGFMGSILRRNRNSTSSIPTTRPTSPPPVQASPAVAVAPSPAAMQERPSSPDPATPTRPPMNRLRKSSNSARPMSVRTASNMSATKVVSPTQPSSVAPRLPDLELDSWPRPASPARDTSVRPSTSDGLSPDGAKRPEIGTRSQSHQVAGRRVQIQAGEEGSEPGEREPRSAIYSQKTGKRKKFGALRKVFGLTD